MIIRVALFGVVIVIVVGAAAIVADRLISSAEAPNETIATRFPEGWKSAPVVEHRKPRPWPSAIPRMSTDEFNAAVTAVGRLRPPPRSPQPSNAVFNDAQIQA